MSGKKKYEKPVIVPLGELVQGSGKCEGGSSAFGSGQKCETGGGAGGKCETGSNATGKCQMGGTAAKKCEGGGAPR